MLTAAAIWYTDGQDEPSCPFVLDLDCHTEPTLVQLCVALKRWLYNWCLDNIKDQQHLKPDERQTVDFNDIRIDINPCWGHLNVDCPDWPTLIVSVRDDLATRLGLQPEVAATDPGAQPKPETVSYSLAANGLIRAELVASDLIAAHVEFTCARQSDGDYLFTVAPDSGGILQQAVTCSYHLRPLGDAP